MNWIELNAAGQLAAIKEKSFTQPQVIFKHSTRCSISSMVKSRLEKGSEPPGVDFYFLDLVRYRELSNQVANDFDVWHESPQLILVVNGQASYDESHNGISMAAVTEQLAR